MQRKIFFFIIFLSFILIGTAMGNNLSANQETETSEYDNVLIKEFPVALQCWTFRKFSFMETLDKAKELGIKYLEAYPGQKFNSDGTGTFNVGMTKDEMIQAKNKLKELGITLKLFGVAGFEDELRLVRCIRPGRGSRHCARSRVASNVPSRPSVCWKR